MAWSCIPHKTTLHGGKSGWVRRPGKLPTEPQRSSAPVSPLLVSFRSGYPDSTYLARLAEILTCCGVEEAPPTLE